jgi:hypothetical protein
MVHYFQEENPWVRNMGSWPINYMTTNSRVFDFLEERYDDRSQTRRYGRSRPVSYFRGELTQFLPFPCQSAADIALRFLSVDSARAMRREISRIPLWAISMRMGDLFPSRLNRAACRQYLLLDVAKDDDDIGVITIVEGQDAFEQL